MKNPLENIEPAFTASLVGAGLLLGGIAAMAAADYEFSKAAAAPHSDQFDAAMQLGDRLWYGGAVAGALGVVVGAASVARLYWINRRRS